MKHLLSRYPLDPAGKSAAHRRVLLALTAAALLCAGFCLSVTSLYFGALYLILPRLTSYFDYPMLILLNTLPILLALFGLFCITNRAWLSFALTSAVTLGMTFGNYFKCALRNDPFVAEDIRVIGDAFGIAGEYQIRLGPKFQLAIALCAAGTIFLLLFCRGRFRSGRTRFLALTALLAVTMCSYRTWYQDAALYNSFENYSYFNRWEPREKFASRGFVYPFLYSLQDAKQTPPAHYSPTSARALLDSHPASDIPDGQKVNIIGLQLESFTDLEALGLPLTNDPYADWRALCAEGVSGTLVSDSMGGGTINAERSFLTGYLYPHTNYRHATASYVRYFAAQGYRITGSHPGNDWFYNRKNVMQNLGFPEYFFLQNHYASMTGGEYGYDDVLLPELRRLYEAQSADGTPLFTFGITFQGHSPYDTTGLVWGDTEYLPRGSELSYADYYAANNYLAGVADTGARLRRWIDSFRDDEAPVVIVLYGDHKPSLGDGNSVYTSYGVSLDTSTKEGLLNYYATPYLIWANDAAKAALHRDFTGEGPTIGPYFLMTELFDLCGWEGPSYLQLTREAMAATPVLQATHQALTADGTLVPTGDAAEQLEIAQFYLRSTVCPAK